MEKNDSIKVVLATLLILLIGSTTFIINKEEKNKTEVKQKESIALKLYAESLLEPFFEDDYCGAIFDMYQKDKYESSNMEKEKGRAIIRYFNKHSKKYDYYKEDEYDEETGSTISYIYYDRIQYIAKLLFGDEDYEFPKTLDYNSIRSYELVEENNEKMIKEIKVGTGCTFIEGTSHYKRIIKSTKEENNKFIIKFDYAFVDYYVESNDSSEPDVFANIKESNKDNAKILVKGTDKEEKEIEKLSNDNKLNSYTYTFIEKDGNYIFEKAIKS